MKNCSLLEISRQGKPTYKLVWEDGVEDKSFAYVVNKIHNNNTANTYAYAIAAFLDFLYEGAKIKGGMTNGLLLDLIDSYELYLLFGEDSSNADIELIESALHSPLLSPSSITPHFAAINKYLELSEKYRAKVSELQRHDLLPGDSYLSDSPLFKAANTKVKLSERERRAMMRNSVFACLTHGGPKLKRDKELVSRYAVNAKANEQIAFLPGKELDEMCFPYDKFPELLKATKNKRDRALWCLEAASGCRISEALTVTWDDIDIVQRKVYIVDPKSRLDDFRKFLSLDEIKQLSHKGRQHEEAFLIEPFKSMFFEALHEYITSNEYIDSVPHNFVFQRSWHKERGSPHFLSSHQTILGAFKKAARIAIGDDVDYGTHSLRHMYGYYLVNWCPTSNGGLGLDITDVQIYMGHKDIRSTKKYARKDYYLLQATISFANALVFLPGMPKTIAEKRKMFLERQITKLELEIKGIEKND